MKYELCYACNQPTGRAGRGEDSLYLESPNGEIGPLCESCWGAFRRDDLEGENATLTRRVEDAEKELIRAVSQCEEACLAERRALDRVEELEGVLRWYAEQTAGCRLVHSGGDKYRNALSNDGGERAAAALAAKGGA